MPLPLVKQTDLISEIAEESGFSKGEVKRILVELEASIIYHVGECHRVKIGNLLQVEPKVKAKSKKRMGRNPQTGEAVEIAAKPASVRVAVRILKPLKESAPPLPRLRKRLSA